MGFLDGQAFLSTMLSRLFVEIGLSPPHSLSSERRGVKLVPLLMQGGGQGVVAEKNYAGQHTTIEIG